MGGAAGFFLEPKLFIASNMNWTWPPG